MILLTSGDFRHASLFTLDNDVVFEFANSGKTSFKIK
jgi:hypothetical protein